MIHSLSREQAASQPARPNHQFMLCPSPSPPLPRRVQVASIEQERDRACVEAEQLQLHCKQLQDKQARLVEEHSKTLERVDQLWRRKWPVTWDEVSRLEASCHFKTRQWLCMQPGSNGWEEPTLETYPFARTLNSSGNLWWRGWFPPASSVSGLRCLPGCSLLQLIAFCSTCLTQETQHRSLPHDTPNTTSHAPLHAGCHHYN